ncbi:MAG TPA: pyridoxamine 5'-phosphate oxidase family protein [Micromonosporaceae bacterium]|jgi:hypothetical protein
MRWTDVEKSQPKLAAVGRERLIGPGVVLVGTIRRDGTPRISAVEPLVLDGDLWLSMMEGSAKARDLRRDPRILIHSIVSGPDGGEGEFKIRGTADESTDHATQQRYATVVKQTIGWAAVPGRFHLFRIDAEELSHIGYDKSGDQHVTLWPQGREYVRRATTPTSLGDAEPERRLL